jgi:hypothetical protein
MCRPPIALERLKLLSDGRLLYRLKKHWRDGTSHILFHPLELMERLAALVLAPSASWRRRPYLKRQFQKLKQESTDKMEKMKS